MNFKTSKDIIIRVVKNFLGVTVVGALVLLIAMMFFAESIIFSKEVLGLLIGIAILFLGIGGLTSAVLIFFCFCTKKIAKLEKALATRDRIIANQSNQLKKAQVLTIHDTSNEQQSETSATGKGKDILNQISDLSEEASDEEISDEESLIDELPEMDDSIVMECTVPVDV